MKVKNGISIILIGNFLFFSILSCKKNSHIEKYQVNIDSLATLPDGSYGYYRGRTYYSNENYSLMFAFDNKDNIKNIIMIDTLKYQNGKHLFNKTNIDTTEIKKYMQKFLDLSRKFKFGHIIIDKSNKISFSYNREINEEYVKTFNDSLKQDYLKNIKFSLLENGWFEYNDR